MAQLVEDTILDASAGVHRPRNLDWKRAAALLYGDWGTSKAYVIGLAFVAAGFSSFPIILAVCVLTAVVAYNYIIVCAHFPDGGGVYSAARQQSRFLASTGAPPLLAQFLPTAARGCRREAACIPRRGNTAFSSPRPSRSSSSRTSSSPRP